MIIIPQGVALGWLFKPLRGVDIGETILGHMTSEDCV